MSSTNFKGLRLLCVVFDTGVESCIHRAYFSSTILSERTKAGKRHQETKNGGEFDSLHVCINQAAGSSVSSGVGAPIAPIRCDSKLEKIRASSQCWKAYRRPRIPIAASNARS